MKRRGGRLAVNQEVTDADDLVEELTSILAEAEDKENVKRSIKSRLLAAAQMRHDAPPNMSSMDATIDETLRPYEGDDELFGEVDDRMEEQLKPQDGARRKKRKTRRKVTKNLKKTRKYSRRH